ncbi:MAG: DNA-3-methyladenine glycosylase I [Pseudomonadota bacterium]
MMQKQRCFGNKPGQDLYAAYHDTQWGIPVYDDRLLFEMLVLEGAQAGLNWETILKKREGYREAFYQFDVQKVAAMTDVDIDKLCQNPKIIRNRLKIASARNNAKIFIAIQKEFGSFSDYLWAYVDHKPINNHWPTAEDVPTQTPLSIKISKDLKKRGFRFVGSTIIYAYLQAIGIVNGHSKDCYLA